jgi:hypothetical protein
MKTITDNQLDTIDYIDAIILTRDNVLLNETIKSIYYTLVLEDIHTQDIEEYILLKVKQQLNSY